jgi:hypothetical protein
VNGVLQLGPRVVRNAACGGPHHEAFLMMASIDLPHPEERPSGRLATDAAMPSSIGFA